jgi:hypothetical protein
MSMMYVADLMRRLKEVDVAFEEASVSLQHDEKLYLTEEDWGVWWKKHEVVNYSSSGARGGDVSRGQGRHGCGHEPNSSSSGPSNKPTGDECKRCEKLGL